MGEGGKENQKKNYKIRRLALINRRYQVQKNQKKNLYYCFIYY